MAWEYGDVVVTWDVIDGKPWVAVPQYVVDDTADLLVTYLPEGAPFGYLPDSDHPWYPQPAWQGSGALELRRPGDTYSVLHFWRGAGGEFSRVVREPRGAVPSHVDRIRLLRRGARHRRAPRRLVVLQGLGPARRARGERPVHGRAGGADPRRRPAHRRRSSTPARCGGATSGSYGSPTPTGRRPRCPTAGATSPSDPLSPSKCRAAVKATSGDGWSRWERPAYSIARRMIAPTTSASMRKPSWP